MFLSTPVKIFCCFCCLTSIFSGCDFGRNSDNSQLTFASSAKPEVPFTVHEPEVFQADLVIRAGEGERRIFIARDHQMQRTDYDVGTDDHRAVIVADKLYLIDFKRNSYTERSVTSDLASLYEPLTAQLMNLRDYSVFEETGRQGSIIEYRVRTNGSTVSETSIFFDESIGMPIKHEIYAINGAERELEYSAELQNFETAVEQSTFEIPKGFKKNLSTR